MPAVSSGRKIVSLERSLRVGTINVRGLATKRRQNQLYRIAMEQELDIIAVQETKVQGEDQTDGMLRPFSAHYSVCVSHAVGTSGGCVLLVRSCLGIVIQSVISCPSGRFVVCDFVFAGNEWRVFCLYAPTDVAQRLDYFGRISEYCNTDRILILLGDFNCVCSARDKTSTTPHRETSTIKLMDIINDFALEDVGECITSGHNVQFTHFQGSSHARLDRAYVSLDIVPLCKDYCVTPLSFTDHCLVMFSICSKKERKGKFNWDSWKINNKLLDDDVFKTLVHEGIQELYRDSNSEAGPKWEIFKQKIKMKAVERSSILKHEERIHERLLRSNLQTLVKEECLTPGTFKGDIRVVKEKLELLDMERFRGAIIRARAEKTVMAERPTKRALGTEKSYAQRNIIAEITYNGALTSAKDEIEKAFYEYYSALFSLGTVDIDHFKSEFLAFMPQLDDETKDRLQLSISVGEVEKAIEDLNPGKSPGPDGLSAALYKTFTREISPILGRLFNEAFEFKSLPPSFLTSHTIFIPKTNDSIKLRQVSAYRPISLTNVDYKIFMKIVARRLQSVIKEIVGPHQTCGIKGRSIFTNIHKARCVLECCDVMKGAVAMLQIDFEKAFDRVPHDLLITVLEHANVGTVITEAVRMAYSGCSTRLIVNKEVGNLIQVRRSVRQGCPISPLLFCMFIESFCLSIINRSTISGFRLHASEVRVLAYADDIGVFCSNLESIAEVITIVKRFCQVSGSAVNWGKCIGFWHGDWDLTPQFFLNVQWVTTPVKYLGVPLENYTDSDPYWRRQTEEIREKAAKWKGRDLSIFARATVCNLFFISKLWYVLQVLYCSRVNVQRLHRVFAVFIWGSTWERTSRTNLFRRVRDGGLSLSHLFLRQLVNRFLYLRDVQDPFLRTVCQVRLVSALPNFVISSNKMEGRLQGYLKEVVESCRFLEARFSIEYLSAVSRKKLYNDLCDIVLPIPLYRTHFSGGKWRKVLKRVKSMPVRPGVKTFFFKLHAGVLPVKTWLSDKGFFVPWGDHCFLCRKPETIEHVFLECWDGVFFWDVLQRTLKKDFPLDAQGIRYLMVDNEDGFPYDITMLMALHSIWTSRMAVRHADVDARPAIEYFRESLISFLEMEKVKKCVPDWVPRMEGLLHMKQF